MVPMRLIRNLRDIGKRLVTEAESFAWGIDCARVEITSGDHRSEAHAFQHLSATSKKAVDLSNPDRQAVSPNLHRP
jgi:hypothetical protein